MSDNIMASTKTAACRSKVAAATASVVPFHCVICFEEFGLVDRPPMVLPCGHTFVCLPCSKRLKRCMECREPLFYTIPKKTTTVAAPQPLYGRYSPTPSTPPHHASRLPHQQSMMSSSHPSPGTGGGGGAPAASMTQVPLPIPKNVVLISMMEAAQRQAKEQEKEHSILESDDDDEDDEEEFDLNRIICGMATLSGPCGTYAVKENLSLLTADPRKVDKPQEDTEANTDADSGVTSLQLSLSQSVSGEIEIGEPMSLPKGTTLQVVDFEDGVAKLARGAGYVVATSSQLVKIGEAKESTCRLEGLLDTVKSRGKDLQQELEENNKIEASIRSQIEAELETDPSHPVIQEAPKVEELSQASCSREACSTPTDAKKINENLTQPFLRTPEVSPDLIISETGHGVSAFGQPAAFPISPNSIDNADIHNPGLPSYRMTSDTFDDAVYGCGAAFLGSSTLHLFDDSDHTSSDNATLVSGLTYRGTANNENRDRTNSSPDGHHHSHRQLSPTLTASFDAIDFRTGLSGHCGLNNAKKKHQTSQWGSPNTRSRLMMSEHRGIARAKPRGPLNRTSASNTP